MAATASQIISRDLVTSRLIDNPAGRIFDRFEGDPGEAIDGEDQRRNFDRHARQINLDLLIIAIARSGPIVTGMNDAAIAAAELAEPDGIDELAGGIEHHAGRIQINARAGLEAEKPLLHRDIPTQAHCHLAKIPAATLLEAYRLPFRQINQIYSPNLSNVDL